MNDYTKGAFECLSWLEAKMEDLDRDSSKWESLRREVGDAINDIRRGVGVDFRERLRASFRVRPKGKGSPELRPGSKEVFQLPEVPPDGFLDEVGDACVAVLAALDYLFDLLREGLRKVDRVVPVLPAGHSKLFQPLVVNKLYIINFNWLVIAKERWKPWRTRASGP